MCLENIKPKTPAGELMLKGIKEKDKPIESFKPKCEECCKELTQPEETYSKNKYNKLLCRQCQKKFQ